MKPFDLQAALDGAKVVTRLGYEVTQLVKFDVRQRMTVAGVVNGNIYWWKEDGTGSGNCNALDMFMYEPKKKKARIIIEWEE
jgi:hypothetical protein